MSNQLKYWNISCLFALTLLFSACEKEQFQTKQELNPPTSLLQSRILSTDDHFAASPETTGDPSLPILFGRASVICVQAPCPCIPIFGYCDEDPWTPWDTNYRIPDQYGGAYLSVDNQRLHLALVNPIGQNSFVINNIHQISTNLSQALGYSSITLLPGEYPIDYSNTTAGEAYVDFSN